MRVEEYEGVPIWRCSACGGAFLSGAKLQTIRHGRARTADQLKAEATAEFVGDTRKVLRCPSCGGHMDKRPISSRYSTMTYDNCRTCRSVWLDAGELAVLQLVYEATNRGTESLEFQKRMEELEQSPERKAQFEEAMSRLPEDLPSDEPMRTSPLAYVDLLRLVLGLFR